MGPTSEHEGGDCYFLGLASLLAEVIAGSSKDLSLGTKEIRIIF